MPPRLMSLYSLISLDLGWPLDLFLTSRIQEWCAVIQRLELKKPCSFCLSLLMKLYTIPFNLFTFLWIKYKTDNILKPCITMRNKTNKMAALRGLMVYSLYTISPRHPFPLPCGIASWRLDRTLKLHTSPCVQPARILPNPGFFTF